MKLIVLYASLFCSTTVLNAQPGLEKSSKSDSVVRKYYATAIAENSLLFNGTEYYYDDRSLAGHPFLETTDFVKGTVTYNNILYTDIPLSYDILRDQVVAFLPTSGGDIKMKLITEKINAFSIGGRSFVHVIKDSAANISNGFYEVLHNGKVQLLAKRSKRIQENVSSLGVEKKVEDNNVFYIKKNNKYYEVSSRSSLLDVLNENKSQLSKFIKQSDIRYNKDVEYNIIRAVRYFDQLTPVK